MSMIFHYFPKTAVVSFAVSDFNAMCQAKWVTNSHHIHADIRQQMNIMDVSGIRILNQ